MRRFLTIFLLVALFGLPLIAGCYETPYDEPSNPNRPEGQQVEVEGGAPDAPAEEAAPEDTGE